MNAQKTHTGMTRRRLMAAAVGVATAGCSRPRSEPLVSIVRAPSYGQDLFDKVRRLIDEHKLNVRGKRVVLKPNLVEFDASRPINTSPLLVHAALEAFRAAGADVRIAEGPGHRRATLDMADQAGYFAEIPGFENVFTDLNLDDVSRVKLVRGASPLRELYLPNTVLSCDLLVSMPKMKTHHWVGATLSMKNFFGLIPGAVYGWPKNVLHWAGIHESIADIYSVVPRRFAIVDGIDGMEGNGPIQGLLKHAGVLVAGRDLIAVDATCCRVMGIDPTKILYLKLAESARQTNEASVRQVGETIATVQSPFALLPDFQSIRL
jgi:uncharacterized protein (DUF362 family)